MRFQAAAPEVITALQLALRIKRFEASLYTEAVASAGFVPAEDVAGMTTIRDHETEHVNALAAAITARGGTPAPAETYDWTAGGAFPFNFNPGNYPTFLGLAQSIEDLGTRALKGQLPNLMSDKAALGLAMAMHAVEAQHASRVRRLRGQKAWPEQASRYTLPEFLQPVYTGEDVAVQAGVNVATLPLTSLNGGVDAATSAFDEPIAAGTAAAVIDLFAA
jgi:hypothetical protein